MDCARAARPASDRERPPWCRLRTISRRRLSRARSPAGRVTARRRVPFVRSRHRSLVHRTPLRARRRGAARRAPARIVERRQEWRAVGRHGGRRSRASPEWTLGGGRRRYEVPGAARNAGAARRAVCGRCVERRPMAARGGGRGRSGASGSPPPTVALAGRISTG